MTTVTVLPFFVACFFYAPIIFCTALIVCLVIILLYEWPLLCNYKSSYFFLKTVCYPITPFGALIFLYLFFRLDLALLWAYVCLFDTSCYCIGNMIGATSITAISPKKTWEGLIGGTAVSLVLFFIFCTFVLAQLCDYIFFIFYFFVSVAAFVGDLFESWLKRNAHKKDSGNILPGHGGLLDRFDSILFAAIWYICILFYMS